ncbi:Non-specific lipid-transfer protein, putative isoform 2 [Hibiscus syriacus]|uniref:Non-specific lipid-transfer protein, putative isoform 2 n=1 Tax=Hibiscus syriacus TaxID=106335 RepID=A0A6A3AFP9_HIBSY|nr:non-specific lipid transfer protein GPI-anchored 19-like [Hibiscus syriacus]KAE8702878.1 Non-specific lipid-transfer protein, putative isoform 2 [Hibiscus syriacus]
MASRKITLAVGLVMVMVTLLWARTMAAEPDCIDVVITMAPCIDYVTGNSSTPSATCCSQLATVVRSDVRCLCMVLNGGGPSLGVEINQTLALSLPKLCNVKTPPPSNCKNDANGTSPSVFPPGSPQGLPDTPTSNSSTSGGSKTRIASPSAVILKILLQFTLLLLPIALYSSTWTSIF